MINSFCLIPSKCTNYCVPSFNCLDSYQFSLLHFISVSFLFHVLFIFPPFTTVYLTQKSHISGQYVYVRTISWNCNQQTYKTPLTITIKPNNFIFFHSYQERINRLSAIYRDEPLTASERVVYWMEFLVRHGGAKHLRSAANDLNLIQYHLLDVYFVLILFVLATMFVIVKCIKLLCRPNKVRSDFKIQHDMNGNWNSEEKKTK